jgi:hypothetical protein
MPTDQFDIFGLQNPTNRQAGVKGHLKAVVRRDDWRRFLV